MARKRVGRQDDGEGTSNPSQRRPRNPVEAHPEDHPDLPEPIPREDWEWDEDEDEEDEDEGEDEDGDEDEEEEGEGDNFELEQQVQEGNGHVQEDEDGNNNTGFGAGQNTNGGVITNGSATNARAMAAPLVISNPKALECFICRQPYTLPVFQCYNGHTACSPCCTKVKKKCPICKMDIAEIRCRAVERVIESVKVPCQNVTYGCKDTPSFNEKTQHETTCVYVPCRCPYVGCNFLGPCKELGVHYRQEHKGVAQEFDYGNTYSNPLVFEPDHLARLIQARSDGSLFIVARKIVEQVGNLVSITWIGPNTRKPMFKYGILATTGDKIARFESFPGSIQGPSSGNVSSEYVLVPFSFCGLADQLKLLFCVYKFN